MRKILYKEDEKSGKDCIIIDIQDNLLIHVEGWHYNYYCLNCGCKSDDMEIVKETGHYQRNIILKCNCGKIVKYQG